MNKYEISTVLLSELTIEQVEDLFTEFVNSKIGSLVSGKGEVLAKGKFETVKNEKCSKVNGTMRPRCMWLDGDICNSMVDVVFRRK